MTSVKLCVFALGLLLSANIAAKEAILTWVSEPEVGQSQINIRSMQGEAWLPVESIYRTRERNYAPAVGRNKLGDVLVVWASKSTARSILRAKFYQNGKWQDVTILSNQGGETTTPAIIFDRNDNAMVAWVSDHNGLDDIYIRRWDHRSDQWSLAERVNAENNVPDYWPSLSLDRQGNVVVQWQAYDIESQAYIVQSRVYPIANDGSYLVDQDHRELSGVDIEMPDDWQDPVGRAALYFPENEAVKSEKLAR